MRVVLLAILALALVVTAGCASSTVDTSSTSLDLGRQTYVISASWPEKSLDMKELGRAATLVVSGVVVSKGQPTVETLTEGPEAGRAVVYADAMIRPDRVLKGRPVETDETVSVRLLGGTVDGYTLAWDDEAELTEGDHVVLFLTDSPNQFYPRDNGFQCAVLWAMHGAFRIQGDIATRSDHIPAEHRQKSMTDIADSVR
jgi:hypothetical protein